MCHVHARQRRALRAERVMFAVSQWAEIRARQFGEFPLRAMSECWHRPRSHRLRLSLSLFVRDRDARSWKCWPAGTNLRALPRRAPARRP